MTALEGWRRPASFVQRVPIIGLKRSLIVPIQDLLTEPALDQLRDDVTTRIAGGAVEGLILDVSAVEAMDSYFTRVVRDLALTARLMGIRTVVCGVSPMVAITMIEMGLDMPGVSTALDLERALERLEEDAARERAGEGGDGAADDDR
jgi:rsbT antagonist protein RsbS